MRARPVGHVTACKCRGKRHANQQVPGYKLSRVVLRWSYALLSAPQLITKPQCIVQTSSQASKNIMALMAFTFYITVVDVPIATEQVIGTMGLVRVLSQGCQPLLGGPQPRPHRASTENTQA